MSALVLSLFPGVGLLDKAFEETGFCVVRGPDLLWGGDIASFHPPAERFDGVIGGPPCQLFSTMRRWEKSSGSRHGNKIPEFERVVDEANPRWFLMENVEAAPIPAILRYEVHAQMVRDVWCGGETTRWRRFSFGLRDGAPRLQLDFPALHRVDPERAALASGGARVKPHFTKTGHVRRFQEDGGGLQESPPGPRSPGLLPLGRSVHGRREDQSCRQRCAARYGARDRPCCHGGDSDACADGDGGGGLSFLPFASARAPVPANRQAGRCGEYAAAARIAALEAENQTLRDRLDFYELTVFGDILQFPATWNLTRAENRIMGVLLSLNVAHRDAIMTAVYGDSPDLEPDAKIVDVMVCKLRPKMRRHGVDIRTVRGLGFAIDQPRRSEIRRALRMISPPFPWETSHG